MTASHDAEGSYCRHVEDEDGDVESGNSYCQEVYRWRKHSEANRHSQLNRAFLVVVVVVVVAILRRGAARASHVPAEILSELRLS